ncbi:MAG: transglycosylase domain-containing protein, partial [Myxococcota bacterium]
MIRVLPRLALLLALAGLAGVSVLLFAPSAVLSGYDEAARRLDAILADGVEHPFTDASGQAWAAIALVAQEDRRLHVRRVGDFSLPWDLQACARAALRNLGAGRIREGCSTLPMQLAKLAVPPEARRRSLSAKVMQLRLAARTTAVPPDAMVSAYLRVLPCASSFAHGLEDCAVLRFGRRLEALRPAEIMLLAAAVQAPGRDLQDTPESRGRARARLERVVASALDLGFLSRSQAEQLVSQPLEPVAPDLNLLRARREGHDPALTHALAQAVEAAWENAVRKQTGPQEAQPRTAEGADLVVAGALYTPNGDLLARVGPPAWFRRPIEAGSWVKPFVVEALLEAGLGETYLTEVEVPLHVPLVTRDGKPWNPRNAVPLEDHSAPPMAHVMRSINTGTLASLLYAFIYLPADDSADLIETYLSARERRRFTDALDRELSLEMASAYAGAPLNAEDVPDLPGYRQISLAATRMVLERMGARVSQLEVPHEDLAALLGVVRAPADALARGLARVWLHPDGELRSVGRLMSEYATQGTLRWLGPDTPAVYKTATADRNAGLAALVHGPDGPMLMVLIALRPSG